MVILCTKKCTRVPKAAGMAAEAETVREERLFGRNLLCFEI